MRRLVYYVACTIDGFIAREDGSFDWFLTEGEHFADLLELFPETFPAHLRDRLGVRGKYGSMVRMRGIVGTHAFCGPARPDGLSNRSKYIALLAIQCQHVIAIYAPRACPAIGLSPQIN